MTLVLTVPHAACLPPKKSQAWRHPCDKTASRAAAILAAHLRAAGYSLKVFQSRVPRTRLDMNRRESRRSGWRRKVSKALADGGARCLLDVHSFPDYDDWGLGAPVDLVVLSRGEAWHDRLVREVRRDAGVRAARLRGSRVNDIVMEARGAGVSSVLLEFREGLPEAQLSQICGAIAGFLASAEM